MNRLLDTSICVDLLRGTGGRVAESFARFAPADLAISTVTEAELQAGVEMSRRRDENARRLGIFLAEIGVLAFDRDAAAAYGRVQAELSQRGLAEHLDEYDKLIAAHALAAGLRVVTANPKDFSRIAGLPWEDWRTGASAE